MTERFFAADSPPTAAVGDDSAITFGVEFTVSQSVALRQIGFFQATSNSPSTATRQVGLYSTTDGLTGTLLAGPFDLPVSGPGWTFHTLASPVTLNPGTVYRAAVLYPAGRWVQTVDFFATVGRSTPSGNATAPPVATALQNAQMSFTTGASLSFPTSTFDESNYWIDVVVDTPDSIEGAAVLPALTAATVLAPSSTLESAGALPALTAATTLDEATQRRALATPVLKAALVDRLRDRAATTSSPLLGVNVLDRGPVTKDDVWTDLGTEEYVALIDATGTVDVVVLNAGNLRFDETMQLTVQIETLGQDTLDTQTVADDRLNVLIYEVLEQVATQKEWLSTYTGAAGGPDLSAFDYVWTTPAGVTLVTSRIEGRPQAAGAGATIALEVRARRTYP